MIIIGEKINGTIEEVRSAILERDADTIALFARTQVEAGVDYLDLNVATGEGGSNGEIGALTWTMDIVRGVTDGPVSLDSSNPEVIERGLALLGDSRSFINSVTGEAERLERILPLVAKYNCPVVALAMDDSGIPGTPEDRLAVCFGILERARDLGIPESNLYFDPLVLPVSTDCTQGQVTLRTLELIKRDLPGCRSIMGLSNVSFGLPLRRVLNSSMLCMCVMLGLDAVLMDPTDAALRASLLASTVLTGKDTFCSSYIKAYREGLLEV